jgi:thiosulfate dehydrogenase (quinone) large subunit
MWTVSEEGASGSRDWSSWALFVIRVAMGLFFLMEAQHQLFSGYIGGDDLAVKLQKAVDDMAVPGYSYLLEHVLLEIDGPLTVLVIIGEIAVGAGLVLGLFTRLTVAVAFFMNLNFLLMNGTSLGASGVDLAFMIGEVLLFMFAARQALSVDGLLAKRGISSPLMSEPLGFSKRQPATA